MGESEFTRMFVWRFGGRPKGWVRDLMTQRSWLKTMIIHNMGKVGGGLRKVRGRVPWGRGVRKVHRGKLTYGSIVRGNDGSMTEYVWKSSSKFDPGS